MRVLASRVKHWLFPKPAVKAWRRACRLSSQVPRYTPGRIELMGYDLAYTDLMTLCPQWHDIFVRESLRFRASSETPRILDCGANVGLASLYFKRLYPRARVTAYEADPVIGNVLAENLSRNGADDVEVVHAAVWKENGKLAFRCEGADSGAIESLAGELRGETHDVPAIRLRDVLEKEPVDLLKLDIEGAETEVLADCAGALGNVRGLILDLHEFDPARRATARILDLLADAGFAYSLDQLDPLPWRPPLAGAATPFPGRHLCWATLLRAWRT
jgi:FkbM family methyltransferase